MKHKVLFFRKFHYLLLYALLLGTTAMICSSCGGSKNTSKMRQVEKRAKKNPVTVDKEGYHVVNSASGQVESKKVQQAKEKQKKKEAAEEKEAEKAYRDAITRHRAVQTQETRERMDQNLKESNRRYSKKKECFVVRWFRPKDEVEKIEKQRAKETQQRMAATRKKAEENNKAMGLTLPTTGKERKSAKPDPKNEALGGGGTYKEGSATRYVNPSNIQHGGGGTYTESKSKSRVKAESPQGGGGTYVAGSKSKKSVKASPQLGGQTTYNEPKSKKKFRLFSKK